MHCTTVAAHVLAAAFAIQLSGCADEYCAASQDPDGTIHVECPGGEITIGTCYEDLPDLDGDGSPGQGDCALAGAGSLQRALCDSHEAWSTLEACRATITSHAALQSASTSAASALTSTGLALAYDQRTKSTLWVDRNRSGTVDGGEVDPQVFPPRIGYTPDLVADSHGCLAMIRVSTGRSLDYWRDRNCDTLADDSEKAEVSLTSATRHIDNSELALWHDRPMVVYLDSDPGGTRLMAWVDLNDDLQAEDNEKLSVYDPPPPASFGSYFSAIPRRSTSPSSGSSTVYFSTPDASPIATMAWTPGATWSQADVFMRPVEAAERCYAIAPVDDSRFACVSGSPALLGLHQHLVNVSGDLYLGSTRTVTSEGSARAQPTPSFTAILSTGAALWIDGDRDLGISSTELTERDGAIGAYALDNAVLFLRRIPDPLNPSSGRNDLDLERWTPREGTRFLGESCDETGAACAGALVCRVSGNAPTPHCVPAAS